MVALGSLGVAGFEGLGVAGWGYGVGYAAVAVHCVGEEEEGAISAGVGDFFESFAVCDAEFDLGIAAAGGG